MSKEDDELSVLRDENKRLRSRLWLIDPYFPIRESLPDHDEAKSLLKIVRAAHTRLQPQPFLRLDADEVEERERVEVENFVAAMGFVFSLTKTETPTVRYASATWIDRAQMWARRAGLNGIPRNLLLPIVAAGSIPWTWAGDVLFLDLDGRGGKAVDRSRWKKILSGEADLLPPTKVEAHIMDQTVGAVKVQAVW